MSAFNRTYGDVDNVRADVKTLNDILGRQGTNLLLDVIAEHVGTMVLKFNLPEFEVERIRDSIVGDLKDAINERT